MPNLIGVQYEEAEKEIERLNEGLGLELQTELALASEEICGFLTEPNTVACTDPAPDAALLPSATVTLYVSSDDEEKDDDEDEDSDETDHPGKGNEKDKGKDEDD